MNKSIILPILSGLALLIKKGTGYEIQDQEIDILADMILGIVTLVGVFMKPRKEVK